ncbi:MAG TPA: NAD-dependent deacylase [Chloroflexota bacterium]
MTFDDALLGRFRLAEHLVVFTGAGASAESGIPTFRDALTGLWENFDPLALATPEGFEQDPGLIWGWYEWRRGEVMRCKPNRAHTTIADLARHKRVTVITQNVDDLHERAGSPDVVHLHGSLQHPRCFKCGRPGNYPPGIPNEPPGGRRLLPPRCNCGGLLRPGVVWFHESLPQEAWHRAEAAAGHCDIFMSVGTSSVVYPAAELPYIAARTGACVVQVNPEPTELDPVAGFNLRGTAGEVLPALYAAAWPEAPEKAS